MAKVELKKEDYIDMIVEELTTQDFTIDELKYFIKTLLTYKAVIDIHRMINEIGFARSLKHIKELNKNR